MEYKEQSLEVGFIDSACKTISQVQVSENTGGQIGQGWPALSGKFYILLWKWD